MRVQFQTDGGIAYFPGLSQPVTIDSAQLPKADAAELQRLIDAARFFDQPTSKAPRRRGADQRQYTITVELKGRRHTLHLAEPIEDQALLALVEYLSQQAAQQRRADDRSSHS